MNPLQHPSFDDNMHHLDALLTALSNSCGGLVFQTIADETLCKKIKFSTFPASPSSTSGILEVSELGVPGNVWGVIAAKKSADIAPYTVNGEEVDVKIDIHGKLRYVPHSRRQPGNVENLSHEGVHSTPSAGGDPSAAPSKSSQPPTRTPHFEEGDCSEPPVVVSELNWDQNKENWLNILRETRESIDYCISLCDFLEPQMPMQITPDKDSLRYLFPSDAKLKETLGKVATKSPGFAIASRSWLSLLPQLGIVRKPPNHLCDILTVSKSEGLDMSKPNICLWVVVSGSKEQKFTRKQVQYMFTVGRAIKHEITTQSREMPNLPIRCMLHSTNEGDNSVIESTLRELGIKNTQDFLHSVFLEGDTFDAVQRSIALLLLSQESHIKNCAGEQLSVKLSARQARTLLKIKRKRVSYVSSAPGTGKTLCGLAFYKDFGTEHSVYICPTEPLAHYLRDNGCEATLVRNDEEFFCTVRSNKVLSVTRNVLSLMRATTSDAQRNA